MLRLLRLGKVTPALPRTVRATPRTCAQEFFQEFRISFCGSKIPTKLFHTEINMKVLELLGTRTWKELQKLTCALVSGSRHGILDWP
ncbi:hypothetical protein STEG23_021093 [Scotinomys teguina]